MLRRLLHLMATLTVVLTFWHQLPHGVQGLAQVEAEHAWREAVAPAGHFLVETLGDSMEWPP